jgi:hypothetical protein
MIFVAANKAIQGQIDEATLQACCKAVVAHTAHLQSATKAKSDYNSKPAQAVDGAAKLVKEATNALVNETKQVAFQKEQDAAANSGNSFGNIKAEMELEANLQRLRAQLETANNVCHSSPSSFTSLTPLTNNRISSDSENVFTKMPKKRPLPNQLPPPLTPPNLSATMLTLTRRRLPILLEEVVVA